MGLTTEEKYRKILESPILFIETFMKIVDKSGKLVPFKLNPEQRYLLSNMERRNVVLKGRQIGCSYICLAKMLYECLTKSDITCAILSYDGTGAEGLMTKLKMLYRDLPKCVKMPFKTNTKSSISFENGSQIIAKTMGNRDSFRGFTCTFVLVSEAAFGKNLLNQLWAVDQTLVPSASMVVESTPQGINDYYTLFKKAEKKENSYKAFFFPWYKDKIMYKDAYKLDCERWLSTHDRLPTVEELDSEELHLYNLGASIEQLVWRKYKVADGGIDKFHEEYPSNSNEAFSSSGENVFDTKTVLNRLQYIDETPPLKICPYDLPPNLKTWFNRGLYIWKPPTIGQRFWAGVDTSEGIKKDSSVMEVIDSDGFQCAEFRSNRIKPHVFAQVVNDLGIYYNKALLVVEKASAGHVIVSKLKNDFHYTRLYKHKGYDERGKAKHKVGFETNGKTKPIMIHDFAELFETGELCINSEYLLKEMQMFVHTDSGKMQASKTEMDDGVMAMAMAVQGLKHGIKYL